MLDQETKQRINNCRDILVGKIPNPIGQVDQITIALIYKFMDEMDQESISMGGKASFFSVDYAQYAWSNIFDPSVSGEELVRLYGEAIEKMNQNPNIPQLFRDIFKNAFLPYRDPETLKMFLKEIDGFDYSNSERLGDAFEHLLSYMGTQGDAGQFRTPRHIIDFITAVVDPKKDETVLDPACGTAGFLISAFKHILKENSSNGNGNGDQLTPDEKNRILENFHGYDIDSTMVKLSLVNLYLHGFKNPKVDEYDTLTSEAKWDERVDVILANPPFMTPKGGIRPHKQFSIQAKRSEVLFVDYIAEHLNPNGRAGIIVPEGIIFQSSKAYKQLRQMLVENYLWAVVSLPAGVFNPYSGVKTSILFLDKQKAKENNSILFVKIENDGRDLGAQRRAIDKNDLPKALTILSSDKAENSDIGHWVEKERIAESGDWNLSGERYKNTISMTNVNRKVVTLKEIAEYVNGYPFKPSDWVQSGKKIIRIQNLTKTGNNYNYTNKKDLPEKVLVQKGDLLISWSATIGFYIWNDENAYLNQHIFKVVPNNNKILTKYFYYLGNKISESIKNQVHGNTMTHITKGRFENIQIPLPPLSVQQDIVNEIDGYQKIIEGARMVVENYKPVIKIGPEWEKVELNEVCNIAAGGTPSRKINEYWGGNIPWVGSTVCKDSLVLEASEYITQKGLDNSSAKIFNKNTTLVALVGATIGKTGLLKIKSATNQNIAGLYPKNIDELDPIFLFYSIQYLYKKFYNLGSGKFRMANLSFVKSLKIHLPSISKQRKIVSYLEQELEIVNSNKRLIEIYEQTIKNKISEVWGE